MANLVFSPCPMCGLVDYVSEYETDLPCLGCRLKPQRMREGVYRLTVARRKGFVSPTGHEPCPELVWKQAWEWEQRLEKEYGNG